MHIGSLQAMFTNQCSSAHRQIPMSQNLGCNRIIHTSATAAGTRRKTRGVTIYIVERCKDVR